MITMFEFITPQEYQQSRLDQLRAACKARHLRHEIVLHPFLIVIETNIEPIQKHTWADDKGFNDEQVQWAYLYATSRFDQPDEGDKIRGKGESGHGEMLGEANP